MPQQPASVNAVLSVLRQQEQKHKCASSSSSNSKDTASKLEFPELKWFNPAPGSYLLSTVPEPEPPPVPIKELPAGVYTFDMDFYGRLTCRVFTPQPDKLVVEGDDRVDKLYREFEKFWASADRYAAMGLTHKRSVLMHGPAGTGKTAILRQLTEKVVRSGGIVIMAGGLAMLSITIKMLNVYEGGRPVLVVMEDIEQYVNRGHEEELLQLLDGYGSSKQGIFFLSTTNKLGEIPTRLRNRPSRIDRLVDIGFPCETLRRNYLKTICPKEFDVEPLITLSDRFTFAQMKELAIAVIVLEDDPKEVADRLRQMSPQEAAEDGEEGLGDDT